MLTTSVIAARAGLWFSRSGIQTPSGGVARYYLCDQDRNARVSTEITGYAVSALVFLHRLTGDGEFLEAAERSGRFLCRAAWNEALGVYPFEWCEAGDVPENHVYFFDSGIIARGLLALWRVTKNEEYLGGAIRAGRSMIRRFAGYSPIPPILALPGFEPLPFEQRWSREPGCFQLKSALAWLELHEETGEPEFEEQYERVLALALGNAPLFLPGAPEREKVMDRLHAFCYFLEGAMPRSGRPEVRAAIVEGIERAGALLRDIAPEFARSDVYAQLLRARLYADALGAAPLDQASAAEEARAAAVFQYDHADPRIDGGFCFGQKAGRRMPFANPVSTAFCSQALALWEQAEAGRLEAQWRDLI
ncbi:MAG TPA: hypothetical protein DEH78_12625 [Solibacterales bacterium]|nr:hypothetical protein [Bryobacterales bacterium]